MDFLLKTKSCAVGGSRRCALCSGCKALIGERESRESGRSEEYCPARLCVPDLTVGDAAAQLGTLKAVGIIGPQSSRGQVAAWNHQRQGDGT